MNGHTKKWHISTQRDIIWQFKKILIHATTNKPYYARSQLQLIYYDSYSHKGPEWRTHGHRKQISDYLSGEEGGITEQEVIAKGTAFLSEVMKIFYDLQ